MLTKEMFGEENATINGNKFYGLYETEISNSFNLIEIKEKYFPLFDFRNEVTNKSCLIKIKLTNNFSKSNILLALEFITEDNYDLFGFNKSKIVNDVKEYIIKYLTNNLECENDNSELSKILKSFDDIYELMFKKEKSIRENLRQKCSFNAYEFLDQIFDDGITLKVDPSIKSVTQLKKDDKILAYLCTGSMFNGIHALIDYKNIWKTFVEELYYSYEETENFIIRFLKGRFNLIISGAMGVELNDKDNYRDVLNKSKIYDK